MSNVHGTPEDETRWAGIKFKHKDGWRPPEPKGRKDHGHLGPYASPFRTCWYDGSIHPDDLLTLMKTYPNIGLGEADWKYGWPHKFYVERVPNPIVGQEVCVGSSSDKSVPHTLVPAGAHTWAKFYTEHIADATDLDELAAALSLRVPNIVWERGADGKIMWRGHRGSGVR